MCEPISATAATVAATTAASSAAAAGTAATVAAGTAAAAAATTAGTSFATYAAIAGLAGALVSGTTSILSGMSQQEAAEYNAEMKRRAATDELNRAANEAGERRDKVRILKSQQVTGAAASGIETNSGSALQILTETAGMGEVDALRVVNNAQRRAYGLNAEAEQDIYQGRAAMRTGVMNAGASLLNGASNAYFGYSSAMKAA